MIFIDLQQKNKKLDIYKYQKVIHDRCNVL